MELKPSTPPLVFTVFNWVMMPDGSRGGVTWGADSRDAWQECEKTLCMLRKRGIGEEEERTATRLRMDRLRRRVSGQR